MNKNMIMGLAGVILIGIGLFLAFLKPDELKKEIDSYTGETVATATSVIRVRRGRNGHAYKTTVKFEVDGTTYQKKGYIHSYVRRGEEFTVRYNPDNPKKNYIEGFDNSPTFFKIMGYILAGLGVVVLLVTVFDIIKQKE
ncbi:DUF3592 domain-containing protein [Eubacterium ruminantium]|uniref:DUF3592 domain-containing protein n=1 Tax=Eubacterium ruminantium TaxID=42322 RepID=UPI00156951ED|nr:DUF3592 domain-containing protein [Eubacterium ruminantium]